MYARGRLNDMRSLYHCSKAQGYVPCNPSYHCLRPLIHWVDCESTHFKVSHHDFLLMQYTVNGNLCVHDGMQVLLKPYPPTILNLHPQFVLFVSFHFGMQKHPPNQPSYRILAFKSWNWLSSRLHWVCHKSVTSGSVLREIGRVPMQLLAPTKYRWFTCIPFSRFLACTMVKTNSKILFRARSLFILSFIHLCFRDEHGEHGSTEPCDGR